MKNILIFVLTLILLFGCATKYIEIPVDRVSKEYNNNISVDTLIISDSSIIREKGDTVLIEKYKYIYRTKDVKDTIIKTDTITKIQTIVQQEKKESKNIFKYILIIPLFFVIYKYIINRKS